MPQTKEERLRLTCADCGNEYPVPGENASHHDKGCPVRVAKISAGVWDDPDA